MIKLDQRSLIFGFYKRSKSRKSSPRFYPGTKTKPGSQFSLIHFSGETLKFPSPFFKTFIFF
ncbi:hypothetical protein LEP1GSC172_0496 [Leptospira noguchii]|uniref:Uncharacterized protein n=1 Tax=Leptospira noguchii TaxID=28182 RepID=M6VG41_9LEPT|nr:hypothetical protein LEP1GSC172_0496 [Leptospira noguchii]